MILQRDLANPQHLLGSRLTSAGPAPNTSSSATHRPNNNNKLFNSLTRKTRSRSYLSISAKGKATEPEGERHAHQENQRHSMHYGSYSQLMPEYHENPYLTSVSTSPRKHTQQDGSFGTLGEGRYDEMGAVGVLSQPNPEPMYANPQGGPHVHEGRRFLGVPEEHQDFGATLHPEMEPMSYGTTSIHTSSSRKKRKRSVASASSVERLQDTANFTGALSQPTFLFDEVTFQPIASAGPTGFYGGRALGGSVRQPPMSHYPGSMFAKNSLTQCGEGEGDRYTSLTRTASLSPRYSGQGGSGVKAARHHPHDGKKTYPAIVVNSPESTSSLNTEASARSKCVSPEEEDLPVEWEVS